MPPLEGLAERAGRFVPPETGTERAGCFVPPEPVISPAGPVLGIRPELAWFVAALKFDAAAGVRMSLGPSSAAGRIIRVSQG